MLTRRRLAALAVAGFSEFWWWPRAARAQGLPDCKSQQVLGNWGVEAWYPVDGTAPSYSITYNRARITIPNTGSVSVSVLALTFTGNDRQYNLGCSVNWDGLPHPPPPALTRLDYQLSAAGGAVATFALTTEKGAQAVPLSSATVSRLEQDDSTIKLTFNGKDYTIPIQAASLKQALLEATNAAATIKSAHDRRACTETSGCVLTTAACHAVGLPDDCFELRTMRRLRDRWIMARPFGPAALEWYYAVSAQILAGVPPHRAVSLFRGFYAFRVIPAVLAERLGLHAIAYRWLKSGVVKLERRYAAPVVAVRVAAGPGAAGRE